MGLPVRIVLHAADEAQARAAARAAFARIATLDAMLSDYRPDSELRQLNARAGQWTVVSAELFEVLVKAVEIARASDGAFDPTVGPLVALWRESRRTGRLPEREAVGSAGALTGWRHLAFDRPRRAVRLALPGMQLDLGGIAKGYILQDALRILRARGVASALLESGGDVVVGDAPPGRAGWQIDSGDSDAAFQARARRLTMGALATSGPTAQFIEINGVRYSHVIDPRTGLGVTNHVVARVIAQDAATADALATALTVVGQDGARRMLDRFPDVAVSVKASVTRAEAQPPGRREPRVARESRLPRARRSPLRRPRRQTLPDRAGRDQRGSFRRAGQSRPMRQRRSRGPRPPAPTSGVARAE
jgi:thiamine biosynthesis lipoprotein